MEVNSGIILDGKELTNNEVFDILEQMPINFILAELTRRDCEYRTAINLLKERTNDIKGTNTGHTEIA